MRSCEFHEFRVAVVGCAEPYPTLRPTAEVQAVSLKARALRFLHLTHQQMLQMAPPEVALHSLTVAAR